MNTPPKIFDRRCVRARRDRAAELFFAYDFLLRELASRLADRLPDIRRQFPLAVELGAHTGLLAEYLPETAGIKTLIQTDLSATMIASAPGLRVVADEEWLPFADNSFDLVMSIGGLQWVNDLPGTLIQIHRILKPGGLLLAMVPGGETLKELRASLEATEQIITGGVSPRISPFVDVKDAGALLQRAGFTLPVTDSESLTVAYEHGIKLLQDLRGMGQTSALALRARRFTPRSILFSALDYYRRHFVDEGRLNATFEVVTLTGWKPDAP